MLLQGKKTGGSGLVLDAYPSAACALGLRKLSTAYTGAAIRVRRASDNAEQDIGFSGDDLDLSALSSFCAGTDGLIKTLYDLTGNGNHFTQTNHAYQPRIVVAGAVLMIGDKPKIDFDGVDDFLVAPEFMTSPTVTLITCTKADVAGNSSNWRSIFWDYGAVQNQVIVLSNYNAYVRDAGGQIMQIATLGGTGHGVRSMTVGGTQLNYWTNQTNVSTTNANYAQTTWNGAFSQPTIGRNASSTNHLFEGGMQELLFYFDDRAGTRAAIENNQAGYYGVIL